MNLRIERDSTLQSRVYSLMFTRWFLHVLTYISREKICYIYSVKGIHRSIYFIGFFFIFWMPHSSFLENYCFTVRNVCPLFTVDAWIWRWDDFASVLFQSFEFSDHIPLYKNNLFSFLSTVQLQSYPEGEWHCQCLQILWNTWWWEPPHMFLLLEYEYET